MESDIGHASACAKTGTNDCDVGLVHRVNFELRISNRENSLVHDWQVGRLQITDSSENGSQVRKFIS
jgi:hypothetical protein